MKVVRVVLVVTTLVAALVAGSPATPATAQQQGSISGTVTAEGGGGLAGICVLALPFASDEEIPATTGAGGAYTLDGLEPGNYLVAFNACDQGRNTQYAEEWWREAAGIFDADVVTVDSGQAVTGIDGTLPVAGHITGTVTDEASGQALAGDCVLAFDQPQTSFVIVETQGNGTYDLPVRAGTYQVLFFDCSDPLFHIAELYDDIGPGDPGTPAGVTVTAGQTTPGIDAALALGGAIGGTLITSHTGQPLDGACAVALDATTGESVWNGFSGEDPARPGVYVIGGLPPGTYRVSFNSGDCLTLPGYEGETHPQQVTVQASQVSGGVDAALQPAPDLTAACPEGVVPSPAFSDTSGNVHAAAIDCVAWWEVARGTGGGRYSPDQFVRRDQMASFIARLLQAAGVVLPSNPPNAFSDDEGNPHELAINQLAAVGVVGGTSAGRYSPATAVRRDQMATFLVNAYQEATGFTLQSAADGPVDHFTDDGSSAHQANINKAAEAAFATGRTATTFDPRGIVRRDQMASFLARVLTRLAWEDFL